MDEWPQFQHSKPGVCYQKGPLLRVRPGIGAVQLHGILRWLVLQEDLDFQFLYAQKHKFLDMSMEVNQHSILF